MHATCVCMHACVPCHTCRCKPGYFIDSEFACQACPSVARAAVLGVVAVLASAGLVSGRRGGEGEGRQMGRGN